MIRLALRVRRARAEIVLAELLELAPGGVEEVDVDEETVEFAVYGPPGELPTLPDLRVAAGGEFVECRTTEIADDWADRWRAFHHPLVIGDALCVRPPWEPPAGARLDVVIDPGQAFGTGAHATTSLCLRMLLEVSDEAALRGSHAGAPHPAVIDLGCGSGVLGITAAKLGLGPVLALDFDPLAVRATEVNARVNGVEDAIAVRRLDLRSEAVPAAPLVLANLLGPLLLDWCAQIAHAPAGPGMVIASGLLAVEADRIAAAFESAGLRERRRATVAEWTALTLVRDGAG